MTIWISTLNLFMNFCYGAMIVLMPELNLEAAGLSYSAFFLFKALWYFVAGRVDDGLGCVQSVTFSLALQAIALFAIFYCPEWPWVGRILEGVALAQGTMSSLSVLRKEARTSGEFSSSVGLVLGLGSLGFVLGPVSAFFTDKEHVISFGFMMSGISLALAVAWGLRTLRPQEMGVVVNNMGGDLKSLSSTDTYFSIATLAAVKSVVLGFELNLGWWARQFVHLSALWSGASFILLSLCFACGAFLSRSLRPIFMIGVGPIGFVLLEISLQQSGWLWWLSLILIGSWYGFSISVFYGRLGWQKMENMGRQNALWLFLTDAPIALLPILIWPTRQDVFSNFRMGLTGGLLALSILGYWHVYGSDFRVPNKNSQS